jgi:hypothetical protein
MVAPQNQDLRQLALHSLGIVIVEAGGLFLIERGSVAYSRCNFSRELSRGGTSKGPIQLSSYDIFQLKQHVGWWAAHVKVGLDRGQYSGPAVVCLALVCN